MQRRGAAAGAAVAARGLVLLLALLAATEAKRHRGAHNHYSVDAPSTAGVVGAVMGHMELRGEMEDETSRLQSACVRAGVCLWVGGLNGWVGGWVECGRLLLHHSADQ